MADVLEHRKFVFVSNSLNSNKCWEVKLYSNDDVEVLYGRIGKPLQSKIHSGAGRKKMEALIRDKTRPSEHYDGGCYREIEVLDVGIPSGMKSSSAAVKSELKRIAAEQIATCPVTQRLIQFFTEVNAHDIYQATGGRITYDTTAGTFRTPVGIVTRNNVDAARTLLDKITNFITTGQFQKPFISALEDYLMLIPQDVGRKFDPRTFCGDIPGIQRQSTILDGLNSSIEAVLSSAKNPEGEKVKIETPKLFNVKMAVVEDGKVIDEISKFYNQGKHGYHQSGRYKLAKIYTIDMPTMKSEWDRDGAKTNGHMRLWHGSSSANILSILKNGFVIPPATASHCCGRSLGNGVYFSDQSTKSLNYSTGYWGSKDTGRYFMFYNWVAMGKMYYPTRIFSGTRPSGYDSTFAKAGSVFVNNEMVVYRVSQILPTHLVEFA